MNAKKIHSYYWHKSQALSTTLDKHPVSKRTQKKTLGQKQLQQHKNTKRISGLRLMMEEEEKWSCKNAVEILYKGGKKKKKNSTLFCFLSQQKFQIISACHMQVKFLLKKKIT
jgi:hypothetical protein